MERTVMLALMQDILQRQDKSPAFGEEAQLQDIGFRSLDFSELALRIEIESGRELNFDAAPLREITTVKDVLDFMEQAYLGNDHRNESNQR